MIRNITKLNYQLAFVKASFKQTSLCKSGLNQIPYKNFSGDSDKKPTSPIMLKKAPAIERKPMMINKNESKIGMGAPSGTVGKDKQIKMKAPTEGIQTKPMLIKPENLDKKPLMSGAKTTPEKESTIQPTLNASSISYLTTNRNFSKFFSLMKNYHKKSFQSIYNLNLIEMTIQKIKDLEGELKVMKEVQTRRQADKKTQNLGIPRDSESNTSSDTSTQTTPGDSLFQSKSIKEIESRIKEIPITTLNDIGFKFQLLNFYTQINIDKAFEYFYDNIRSEEFLLTSANTSVVVPNFKKFLGRLVQLDRTPYLQVVYKDYINVNNIDLTQVFSAQEFTSLFSDFFNHHMETEYNYDNTVLGFNYLFNYITTSKSKSVNLDFAVNFTDVFDKISHSKFSSRAVKASNDEMINLIQAYANIPASNKSLNFNFKEESLAKIFTLLFDNSVVIKDESQIFNLIMQISKKHSKFIEILRENLIAYYQYFGFAPKIFSGHNLKQMYFQHREKLLQFPTPLVFTEKELEFFVTLFKYNDMPEFVSDILNNWSKFSLTDISKSKSYTFALADFILSSKLEDGVYYHKQIESLYQKKSAVFYSLVHKTLAYLKDGNNSHAIENFFKELEAGMKSVRENDKLLLDLYKKTFDQETIVADVKVNTDTTAFEINPEEIEYRFNLNKINLLENVKSDIKNIYEYYKTYEGANKFQAQEKVLTIVKNIGIPVNKNMYLDELRSNLENNLKKLKKMNFEEFSAEFSTEIPPTNKSTDMEELYSRIKVELYLDNSKFNLLSEVLEKNIKYIYDLQNLEFSSEEKKVLLDNIGKWIRNLDEVNHNNRKFLRVVQEYITNKSPSYSRVVYLSEEAIRKVDDVDSLFGYTKVQEYVDLARKYFEFNANKYSVNKRKSDLYKMNENLRFLEEIGVNLNKAVEVSNPEEKIKHLENVLSNYRSILKSLYKSKVGFVESSKATPVYRGKLLDNWMRTLILSSQSNSDRSKMAAMNKIGRSLAKLSDRVIYHKMITMNGIRNIREKNIIKAMRNHKGLKSKALNIPNIISNSNALSILGGVNSNNVYFSTLQSLNRITPSLVSKQEESIYIENIFSEFCKTNKIELPRAPTHPTPSTQTQQAPTDKVKLSTMKELMNQDYEHFSIKLAVYMILFGAENNIPEAIRIGEKVCSDLGFTLPTWVETRVNKYLVQHSEEYAKTINNPAIGVINVASVYRKDLEKEQIYYSHGVDSKWDAYKSPSVFAVDYLPFRGLEEIVDLKKFSLIMRNLGIKNKI